MPDDSDRGAEPLCEMADGRDGRAAVWVWESYSSTEGRRGLLRMYDLAVADNKVSFSFKKFCKISMEGFLFIFDNNY